MTNKIQSEDDYRQLLQKVRIITNNIHKKIKQNKTINAIKNKIKERRDDY